jgi:hypothetical protein
LAEEFLDGGAVTDVDLEEFISQGVGEAGDFGGETEAELLQEDFAGEGIAVGMEAIGGHAEEHIAGLDGAGSIEHEGTFHDPDDGTAEVIFPRLIEAGHLGGFAADEGAMVLGAGLGEAAEDVFEDAGLEFAGAEVIEEEERFRAEHGDVVNAMVHEVRTDSVVLVHREGDLELRAHAIHAADEDRFAIFLEVELEEATEAADLAEDFAAVRAGEQLRERGFDFITEININAGSGVGFLFHAPGSKAGMRLAREKISRF